MAQRVLLTKTSTAPWHPGYPFRARGKLRQATSAVVLAGLVAGIGGYLYVTDSRRVKGLAEKYLSQVVGGPVRVGRARLSIFEGLRLDNVTVMVDRANLPDSRLLRAQTLHVSFPIVDLVRGDFSRATIMAVEPELLLVSDANGGAWNFQRLSVPGSSTQPSAPTDFSKISLPQVVLRNARVEYAEIKDGKLVTRGTVAVEGNLLPTGKDTYAFTIAARGPSNDVGPSLTGWAQLSTGQVSASLRNFNLGPDFSGMLPGPVRNWWQRHEVAGSVEIPELSIEPANKDKPVTFRVLTRFEGGAMAFKPEEFRLPDAPVIPAGLPAIRFSNVRGELLFTETGIELRKMSLVHEGNVLKVEGSLAGYVPNAAFSISAACDDLNLSKNPSFLPSLPPEAREVYDRFLPSGAGKFAVEVSRNEVGQLTTKGRLDILNGTMTFDRFPFTCHNITGAIVVSTVKPGETKLEVVDIRGRGRDTGSNAQADLRVNGVMTPLEGGSQVDFTIFGDKVEADDELVAAMPPGVQQALQMFSGPGRKYPVFGGSFNAVVHRDLGPISHWKWPIDINLTHGHGQFEPFPYPLENLTGNVVIDSGFVTLKGIKTTRKIGDINAALTVDGRLTYRDQPEGKLLYDLAINASDVPLDATLINAVPRDKREWLDKLGLAGMLNMKGKVTGLDGHYELGLSLSNGTMQPGGQPDGQTPVPSPVPPNASTPPPATTLIAPWIAKDLSAALTLTPSSLTIHSANARRGEGTITASGLVTWETGTPIIAIDASATKLPLDPELREILPDDGKSGWDAVKPEGSADVDIHLSGKGGVTLDIRPLGATVTPSVLPVKLSNLTAQIHIENGNVTIANATATRNDTHLKLQGTGYTSSDKPWNLTLGATNLLIDDELRQALPGMLKETATALELNGRADLDVRKLIFRPGSEGFAPAVKPASGSRPQNKSVPPTRPPGFRGADADFDVTFIPLDISLKLGVPVSTNAGQVSVAGVIRNDRLSTMTGNVQLKSGDIASRPYTNLKMTVTKSDAQPGLRFNAISADMADGNVAGQAAVAFPDDEPMRYKMELALRNADVQMLMGKKTDAVSGRLSASLSLEGTVDDPASRKGRGDISVTGDRMARVPVLLGLVQVANLSLPGNTAFNNATARYAFSGANVNIEQLAIRSPGLEMVGNGRIDLDARDVRLTLWTAPPDLPRVPVWSDLTDPIRRELLQIQVRGTIDDPKIGASSFDSFTTTVEEVLQSGRGAPSPRKK